MWWWRGVCGSVYCATWNVNAKKPTEDLSSWLRCDQQPEIYAIGYATHSQTDQ